MNKKDLFRMFHWLLLAAVFYVAALSVPVPPGGGPLAQLQTALWKLGHITVGGYAGYWMDRSLLGRYVAELHSGTFRVLARALIVGAVILGVAFGL